MAENGRPEVDLKELSEKGLLLRIAQELGQIRQGMTTVLFYIRDAESEIPEKYRRFVNAFHDVHDIQWAYHENGLDVPDHISREIERLHDRYRQILSVMNQEDGPIGKVRRDMASDPMNKYDHTRQLAAPTHEVKK